MADSGRHFGVGRLRRVGLAAAVGVLLLGLAGCGAAVKATSKSPITIGTSLSLSGDFAANGVSFQLLALALFEHVVAGLGEDEAATQSWLEVESLVLSPALRLTGQSEVSLGAQGPGVPGTAGPGRLGTL